MCAPSTTAHVSTFPCMMFIEHRSERNQSAGCSPFAPEMAAPARRLPRPAAGPRSALVPSQPFPTQALGSCSCKCKSSITEDLWMIMSAVGPLSLLFAKLYKFLEAFPKAEAMRIERLDHWAPGTACKTHQPVHDQPSGRHRGRPAPPFAGAGQPRSGSTERVCANSRLLPPFHGRPLTLFPQSTQPSISPKTEQLPQAAPRSPRALAGGAVRSPVASAATSPPGLPRTEARHTLHSTCPSNSKVTARS